MNPFEQQAQQAPEVMTGTAPSAQSILMGASKSAKFPTPGTVVGGRIMSQPTTKPQTEFGTNKVKVWPSGDVMYQVLVEVQTDQRDDQWDDGVRTIYISGRNLTGAVRAAIREANAPMLQIGGQLWVRYVGDDETATTKIKPMMYEAKYMPPDPLAAMPASAPPARPTSPAPAVQTQTVAYAQHEPNGWQQPVEKPAHHEQGPAPEWATGGAVPSSAPPLTELARIRAQAAAAAPGGEAPPY